uniref:Uncharacterized protein n=1 Tax=Pediastrum angulosum TaxID=271408 RepID=A0A2U8GHK6_9CHLO|nr:hypothetical protein [Pediastrum angulosum]AWI68177.1 hypothetical protein [Pediastrum angulosum]
MKYLALGFGALSSLPAQPKAQYLFHQIYIFFLNLNINLFCISAAAPSLCEGVLRLLASVWSLSIRFFGSVLRVLFVFLLSTLRTIFEVIWESKIPNNLRILELFGNL